MCKQCWQGFRWCHVNLPEASWRGAPSPSSVPPWRVSEAIIVFRDPLQYVFSFVCIWLYSKGHRGMYSQDWIKIKRTSFRGLDLHSKLQANCSPEQVEFDLLMLDPGGLEQENCSPGNMLVRIIMVCVCPSPAGVGLPVTEQSQSHGEIWYLDSETAGKTTFYVTGLYTVYYVITMYTVTFQVLPYTTQPAILLCRRF